MKKQNLKRIVAEGHLFVKGKSSRETCPYINLCNRDCNIDEICATKRFYDRYPDYISLGIRSRL